MKDEELHPWLQKMIGGDRDAFHIVYEHTRDHVYRTVGFLANQKQDILDIASEVYIELFKSLPKYDFQQPFRSWFNGLIIRQVHNWNRKLWRKLKLFQRSKLLETGQVGANSEDLLLQDEHRQDLFTCVNKLPYKLRVVIVLRYYHEQTLEEIASLLTIPVGTVKSRHYHALQKLRKEKVQLIKNEEASLHVH
ncbi:sigma-70 family RNA polymerase sigma factor [Paenibacillus sp. MBLB4367]|uniref:sigma-70 family RNA polymerase sigma factor n=1 Tax=Paenibacillus sp. MBLB4367 TaxID=3384767 RepID=UPI00390800EF